MRPITEIIIHCSATRPDWMAGAPTKDKVAEIRRWHVQDRGWKDIGYHYLIDRDGNIATGRSVDQIGAHVQGHNTGTIGVCLIGGHGSSEKDQFADHFTADQEAQLRLLLAKILRAYPTATKISGHNQYAAKACPGFNVPTWYAKARTEAVKPLAPKPVAARKPADPAAKPNLFAALIAFIVGLFGGKK